MRKESLKKMLKEKKENPFEDNNYLEKSLLSEGDMFRSQNFFKVQKRQILLIVISYVMFNLLNFLWERIYMLNYTEDITCLNDQEYVSFFFKTLGF